MDFAWNLNTAPARAAPPVEAWEFEIGASLPKTQLPSPGNAPPTCTDRPRRKARCLLGFARHARSRLARRSQSR